jgi:cell division protein FtsW (lipid II flippase)
MSPLPLALRLPVAGVLPLLPILIGAWVARAHGVSPKAFGTNIAAAALGLVLAALLGRRSWNHPGCLAPVLAATALALLAATLLFPSLEGVHRWISLGPVRLNASAVTLPWILLALRMLLSQARPGLALGLVAVPQLIHIAQPDAGQATAFSAGVLVLFSTARSIPKGWSVAGSAIAVTGTALAWGRADPLGAVPHVERILHLAADQGVPWLLAALVALGGLFLPMVHGVVRLRSTRSEAAAMALSLGAYFGGALAATELGNFPVPMLGAGAGHVLGWYCALAILRSSMSETPG